PATTGSATESVAGEPRLRVTLSERIRGVAPGQSVVLYDGTRVLGSATIDTSSRLPAPPVK
ncbi:MAG: aminomethyltransferase beta-barrel domain-containing protein, partial [Ornithinibacter sp.]